ncbi:Heat shock 70 kDa protein cognate 4 [Temnothorax longispinosus]|uniref:Heat shock 70 kDa protein cognate 4 n=1 Tax=Temnothorax longispinosus TaxID=300112 RepID=A0A4S2J9U3_9HYME|nr:Heat shock 70 kDa protein cognate 4 [Temnothorax longispinosus]
MQSDMRHRPFTQSSMTTTKNLTKMSVLIMCINGDEDNSVLIYRGEAKSFFPEEISSMVLTKMKEIAEAYLDITITNAL